MTGLAFKKIDWEKGERKRVVVSGTCTVILIGHGLQEDM